MMKYIFKTSFKYLSLNGEFYFFLQKFTSENVSSQNVYVLSNLAIIFRTKLFLSVTFTSEKLISLIQCNFKNLQKYLKGRSKKYESRELPTLVSIKKNIIQILAFNHYNISLAFVNNFIFVQLKLLLIATKLKHNFSFEKI